MANQSIYDAFERMWQHTNLLVQNSGGGSNVFATETPTQKTADTSAFSGAGWYYISIKLDSGAFYNFGLTYFDGSSSFSMLSADGYKLTVSGGYPMFYKDGASLYTGFKLYVAKLG